MKININIVSMANQLGSRKISVNSKHRAKAGTTKLYSFGSEENIVDIACDLARKILAQQNMGLADIDGVFGSSNPTFNTLMPSLTVKFASTLGLRDVVANHVGMGCAGGIQALDACCKQLSDDYRRGKFANYLVIVGDQTNRILDPNNMKTNILFSEAVSILLVSNCNANGYRIEKIGTMSLLEDVEAMRIENPYYTNKVSKFDMDGGKVFKFAVASFPKILKAIGLEKMPDNCYFIPHQANLRIIDAMIEKEGLKQYLVYSRGIRRYGNTSGSAVFCGLEEALRRNLSKIQWDILLGAFGAELQIGSALLRPGNLDLFLLKGMKKCYFPPIPIKG